MIIDYTNCNWVRTSLKRGRNVLIVSNVYNCARFRRHLFAGEHCNIRLVGGISLIKLTLVESQSSSFISSRVYKLLSYVASCCRTMSGGGKWYIILAVSNEHMRKWNKYILGKSYLLKWACLSLSENTVLIQPSSPYFSLHNVCPPSPASTRFHLPFCSHSSSGSPGFCPKQQKRNS